MPTEVVRLDRETDSDVRYKPTFRVRGGPHDGAEHTSRTASNPPAAKVGQVAPGYYDAAGGVVASAGANAGVRRFGIVFSSIGLGILTASAAYWRRTRTA